MDVPVTLIRFYQVILTKSKTNSLFTIKKWHTALCTRQDRAKKATGHRNGWG